MKKREDRRARTKRYAERARRVWVRAKFPPHPVGWFAKGKAIGCRCKRRPTGRPKVAQSLCHAGDHNYHPSVHERIANRRLCRAWERELRAKGDLLDIDLE